MKEVSLQIGLSKEEIKSLIGRYHFEDTGLLGMEYLYKAMEPLVRPKVFYEINPVLPFIKYDKCVISIVTLGKYVDLLENIYSLAGNVSEAYKIDCLSLELLDKTYAAINKIVNDETGQWVEGYDFIGDRYPLEKITEILDYSGQKEVTCNAFFALQPKNSVIFAANLSDKRENSNCNVCSRCRNKGCPNRKEDNRARPENNLSYGYQKIFGKPV